MFTPLANGGCMIEMVAEADIGGSIPGFVQNQVIKQTAGGLAVMKDMIKDFMQ